MGAVSSPVANYIKKLLAKTNVTQEGLAKEIGVSRQTVNSFLTGKTSLTRHLALCLSNYTGDPPDFLFDLNSGKVSASLFLQSSLFAKWKRIGQHTLVDKEIIAADQEDILGIEGFLPNSVEPASYDLHLGTALVSTRKKGNPETCDQEFRTAILYPGETAVVRTHEKFNFPIYLLGRLGCTSELASNGILTIHGHHVDPGFNGYLYVTLQNVGNEDFELEYMKPFLSLEILYLAVEPSRPYNGHNQDREDFSEDECKTVTKEITGDTKVDTTLNIATQNSDVVLMHLAEKLEEVGKTLGEAGQTVSALKTVLLESSSN